MPADPRPFAAPTIIGEAFAGSGPNAAHINVVIGRKGSPVETAWRPARDAPAGYIPFITVLQPEPAGQADDAVREQGRPSGRTHSTLTWGAAQAGVAAGVALAVAEGLIPAGEADELLAIAAVWVDRAADDEALVFANNGAATLDAIARRGQRRAARRGRPGGRGSPANPFFRRGSTSAAD